MRNPRLNPGDGLSGPRDFRAEKVFAPPLTPAEKDFLSHEGKLDLEIGCGAGWHPIRYATENPVRRVIAIERTREKFEKFAGRVKGNAEKGALSNLLPVHADAVAWVTNHLPERSLARVFILYPNPSGGNPAGRWIRMPFFGHLLTKLADDGEILLRTNIEAYANEVREFAREAWELPLLGFRSFSEAEGGFARAWTHFERKYLARGETCYEVRLGKPERAKF